MGQSSLGRSVFSNFLIRMSSEISRLEELVFHIELFQRSCQKVGEVLWENRGDGRFEAFLYRNVEEYAPDRFDVSNASQSNRRCHLSSYERRPTYRMPQGCPGDPGGIELVFRQRVRGRQVRERDVGRPGDDSSRATRFDVPVRGFTGPRSAGEFVSPLRLATEVDISRSRAH